MSDSTPTLDQLSTSSANIPTRLNETTDALSPSSLYGRRASTTTGLTWGYYGGRFQSTAIANGTLALTAGATNYVVAAVAGGAVSVSTATTNWNNTAAYIRLYQIVTGASSVTSYQDHRQGIGPQASGLPVASTSVLGGIKTGAGVAADGSGVLSSTELVNAQTGTSYTYQASDQKKLVTHSNAAAIAASLPQAGASFPNGWTMDVLNAGAGTLTITPATSTIDGAASISLTTGQGVRIVSDGTNYFSLRGAGGYALPAATALVRGGITVGAGLSIAGDVLSASGSAPGTQSITDFANNAGTTTGLTYGYQAGVIRSDNATTAVATGTVSLTASMTNYVETTGAGVVSANTVGFTSGSFPLATVVTGASSITTITDKRGFASVGGGGAAIGFSANKNGVVQSIAKNLAVKITFSAKSFDTANEFNTSTSQWVPSTPGLKLISACIFSNVAVSGDSIQLRLYKNGVQVANGGAIMMTSGSNVGCSATFLQQANGTTDYFEIYTYWIGSGSGNVEGAIGTTSFSGAALK